MTDGECNDVVQIRAWGRFWAILHVGFCRLGDGFFMSDIYADAKTSDVTRNVVHAIHNWPDPDTKLEVIAGKIGVAPSTINRWQRRKSSPNRANVTMLAKCVGLDAALFYEPHDKYLAGVDSKSSYMKRDYKKVQQQIILGSVLKWKHLWDECFERHQGSYFVYNRIGKVARTDDDVERIAVSLLTVNEKTGRGIEFELHNIDDRNRAETKASIHYVYKGLMFPIFDALSFYGEEQSGDEPLTIVTSSSQKSPPSLLSGYLAAIGVSAQLRIAAGAKVVLAYRGKKHLTVSDASKELGVFREDRIAPDIRRYI